MKINKQIRSYMKTYLQYIDKGIKYVDKQT